MERNLDKMKAKVNDIKQNIENKRGELGKLEDGKRQLLDAGMAIQGADIDENVQRKIVEHINQGLEQITEKGSELSDEMNSDFQTIEELKEDTQVSIESTKSERSKMEAKKGILERVGLGGRIDSAISELNTNQSNLDSFNQTLSETDKEMQQISQRLKLL